MATHDSVLNEDDTMYALPIYLVADVSGSMAGAPIDGVNKMIPSICNYLSTEPSAADCGHISIIAFDTAARVELPMTSISDLLDAERYPVLSAGGGTHIAAPLQLLRTTIQTDVDHLKSRGFTVRRPVVILLTDGQNARATWWQEFLELTNQFEGAAFSYYPQIIPFGFGSTSDDILDGLVFPKVTTESYTPRYYLAATGDPGMIMSSMIAGLSRSIMVSARSASQGGWVNPAPTPEQLGSNSPILAKDASPFADGATL